VINSCAADPVVQLLVELIRCGITVAVAGDNLRFRPRDRMTPDLAERLESHKGVVQALLRGDGIGDRRGVHDDTPRHRAAGLIRAARCLHGRQHARMMRDAWHERMAVCVVDGGLRIVAAEIVALDELTNRHLTMRTQHDRMVKHDDERPGAAGNQTMRADAIRDQ